MTKIALTLACAEYDRIASLALGDIQPDGIDLTMLRLPVEEIFWRMLRYREFDVSEMSLSSYLMARSRSDDLLAIPVFPSRAFRHGCIFIHAHSGIHQAADLAGKRVGVPEYQMTAPLWQRALLQHDYGVHPRSITWLQGGLEQPGRDEKLQLTLPEEIDIRPISLQQTLSQMLLTGEIDALLTARIPSSFNLKTGGKQPIVQRLFPHYKQVEQDYFRRTGIFPIMHVIVIKKRILDEHPWVARNLFKAFVQAKDLLSQQMQETAALRLMLPWLNAELEATRDLMGNDFWPYGIEANRVTLNAAARYSHEQGLTPRQLTVEELFAPGMQEEYRI